MVSVVSPGAVERGCVVEIGGTAVAMSAAGAARAVALSGMLGACPTHPGPPDWELRYVEERPPLPRRPADEVREDIRFWGDGSDLSLLHASGVAALATADAVWVGGGCADLALPFPRLALPALTHVLAHRDRFVLHAAAIVPNDKAFVVVGPSGHGKSTVALAALVAGWPVLADDMVVVRMAGPTFEVRGIPRPGAVPNDLEGAGSAAPGDWRNRRRLEPAELTPGWFPVERVVRVGHCASAGGGTTLLGARDAIYALLSAFSSSTTPELLRRFFPVAAALSRGGGVDLRLAADRRRRLGEAARLLAAVE